MTKLGSGMLKPGCARRARAILLRPFHESWYRGAVAREFSSTRCGAPTSPRSVSLSDVDAARAFCSMSARHYELMGRGLKRRGPVDFLCTERGLDGAMPGARSRSCAGMGVGTSPAESVTLAATAACPPATPRVRIGTTSSAGRHPLLIVNAPVDAESSRSISPENTGTTDAPAYIDRSSW